MELWILLAVQLPLPSSDEEELKAENDLTAYRKALSALTKTGKKEIHCTDLLPLQRDPNQ
jgi:hypothetical protein